MSFLKCTGQSLPFRTFQSHRWLHSASSRFSITSHDAQRQSQLVGSVSIVRTDWPRQHWRQPINPDQGCALLQVLGWLLEGRDSCGTWPADPHKAAA